ncbi:Elongation factor 1-delta [Dirofilaria immitis]|nr:Elongation factor 1-delta [Dirofilaria immitis]
MRNEIEKLREDFQKILNYAQQLKPCMSSTLERVGNRTLILGDGNLSFSLAFARLHPETEIYTSVFESFSEYVAKYPSAKKNITELRTTHPCLHILFSVDACLLPKNWTGFYDDIIWNFPHHCGKTNLRKSRRLIRKTFASIGRLLLSGRFHITLAKGQSGLDHSSILYKRYFKYQLLPEHKSDSWNIIYIAAEEYLILQEASIFQPEIGKDFNFWIEELCGHALLDFYEVVDLRTEYLGQPNYIYRFGGDISTLQKQSSSSKIEKSLEELREDDFDLFGSSEDEKDEEKERIKQERLKVRPWDDTTDMRELEKLIREIKQDGLVWGDSKLVPLAFGIYILQIVCVVEDEKVGVDDIISNVIEEAPEHVQSVDVVAFNKFPDIVGISLGQNDKQNIKVANLVNRNLTGVAAFIIRNS